MTEKFQCHARRHMDEEFRVYDAMLAVARSGWNEAKASGTWPDGRQWKESDPLKCYAKGSTLANMTNRSREQVGAALNKLEGHWVFPLQEEQRRKASGKYTTYEYRVVEHDEYLLSHPDGCPPLRYDPATGDKLTAQRLATGLERKWIQRLIGTVLPDSWTDAVANVLWEKKQGTVLSAPVTVATYPEITPEQVLADREPGAVLSGPVTDRVKRTCHGGVSGPVTDRVKRACHKLVVSQSENKAREESQPVAPAHPENEQGKTEKQNPASGVCLSSSGLTDQKATPTPPSIRTDQTKTVREVFDTLADHNDWLAAVSDGELDEASATEWITNGWLNKKDIAALKSCVAEGISAKADQPFLGRSTQAQLMGDAMKRLRNVHKTDVPKPWVPVLRDLRRTAGPSVLVTAANLKKADEPGGTSPRLTGDAWRKANGYEECIDHIWRPPADREHFGYTVKGDDGLWRKRSQ